jgi:hypothetical protein
MFGGLGICSLEAVVAKDGKEYIIEVNDSATVLLGESQEEDRRNIADLVLQQMEVSEDRVAALELHIFSRKMETNIVNFGSNYVTIFSQKNNVSLVLQEYCHFSLRKLAKIAKNVTTKPLSFFTAWP